MTRVRRMRRMPRWGIGAAMALLTLGLVAGCDDSDGSARASSSAQGARVFEAGDSIDVDDGETFVVALEANPSTGYSWSAASNPNVTYVSSTQVQGANRPGAAGTQRLTFRASSPGSSTLVLNYSRPFEQGVAPVETESFPVDVSR